MLQCLPWIGTCKHAIGSSSKSCDSQRSTLSVYTIAAAFDLYTSGKRCMSDNEEKL